MPEKLLSTNTEAYNTLEDISKLIGDIIDSSKGFRNKIETTYDKVELAFLKRLLDSVILVEHDALILKQEFKDIRNNIPIELDNPEPNTEVK
ncbi:hypothetical protein [Vallitalea guaymasensis]|uniref:hypothetical protein n=1 Tax=Vallitalea guaymasensis TaxID=1185412 RepID=UPI000DE45D6C|nr:hypothetical protein [Vallitalea guaymasensis]